MPASTHIKAAEAQEAAAKDHRVAADLHTKGDHKAGLQSADTAMKHADSAHACSKDAATKSKAACH